MNSFYLIVPGLTLLFGIIAIWIAYVRSRRKNRMKRFFLLVGMGAVIAISVNVQIFLTAMEIVDHFWLLLVALILATLIPLADLKDPALRSVFGLMSGLTILVLINFVGSYAHFKVDLTAEKRHTLSPQTIELLESLEEVVYVEVYLEGEFSADYRNLQGSVREKLESFRDYAGSNIEYIFIDPSESEDENVVKETYVQLFKKGLRPSTEGTGAGTVGQRYIWPGALVRFADRELAVNFIDQQMGNTIEQIVEEATEELEYSLTNTIRKVKTGETKKVGILRGHGELAPIYLSDFTTSLKEYYVVEEVDLTGNFKALEDFDALVIPKPTRPFSEPDQFVIDHFIMNGGKTLWLIDPTDATLDTVLASQEPTMSQALARPLNIEKMLFTYGVRLNNNVVMDRESIKIWLPAGLTGGQITNERKPLYYMPVVRSISDHPISRNMDEVLLNCASTIDVVGGPEVKKTPLLSTSRYTKLQGVPARISLATSSIEYTDDQFATSFAPVAMLLEGNFESFFRNYDLPGIDSIDGITRRDSSVMNRMVVVSDGDIIANPGNEASGQIMPLGETPLAPERRFNNKTFLLNCLNYMLEDEDMIALRAREITARRLDAGVINANRGLIQFINVGLPLIILIVIGLIQMAIRYAINRSEPKPIGGPLFYVLHIIIPIAVGGILFFIVGPLFAVILALFFSFWWSGSVNRYFYINS